MRFAWRVPEDAHTDPKEFVILPQKGSILPHGRTKINVEFVSQTVQKYAHSLVMDIPKVGVRWMPMAIYWDDGHLHRAS